MIGLEFVKKIDKDWKNHVKSENGFYSSYIKCPLCGIKLNTTKLFDISDEKW
jgi:hypothetical protein